MTQAINSSISTLVLPNHGNWDNSHDNLYKTAFNASKCIRPMNIKSFLVMKNILSVLLISLSRSSDRSDKKIMILVIVAKMRLIDWTQLVINRGWGSDQVQIRNIGLSRTRTPMQLCKYIVMSSLNSVRLQKKVIYWLYKKEKKCQLTASLKREEK